MSTSAPAAGPASTVAARPKFKERYEHFIGGKWVLPDSGEYFDNISPIDGKTFTKAARGNARDVEKAIDAAHAAFPLWSKTAAAHRSNILLKMAQIVEDNLEYLAIVETIDNGKAIRETRGGDLPLVIDHLRYFAGVIRSEEGTISEHDETTVSINLHEPIGVVGQIIPWNFPLLMATWKMAPALAAGCCIVLKPAEQTPTSIMVLMELVGHLLPPGVLNIVTGYGTEAGKPLASSPRVQKVTMELGGKSPNIFFESVMAADDEFLDKAVEGAVLFALNQGEVCTCPSRILVHEKIYDDFMDRVIRRTKAIKMGNPLDSTVMMGAQASEDQYNKILSYLNVGREEGAKILCGGEAFHQNSGLEHGFYIQPTLFRGNNKMSIFQEEIFGPVSCVTTFSSTAEAIAIANDTLYGLGAGVWTRDAHELYQVPRAIQAGRVWVNCYHTYPAHAPFGGYKKSGFGRETHKMMLNHYRQTKNMLISYSKARMGFF